MSVAIETIGALDIDAVMPIMGRAFDPIHGEAWSRGQCLAMLALPDTWLLQATLPGREEAIGFALARRTLDESELLLIAVDPDAGRRGVGRALIERTAEEAQRRGAARLILEVRSTNEAIALYQAAGFTQIGRRRDYYRGSDGRLADALTLERPLS